MPAKKPVCPQPSNENPYVSQPHSKKTSVGKGTKPTSPAPGPASVPRKPAVSRKPTVPSSARGHAAVQGQTTVQGQGQTQKGVYNQAAPLSHANPSYQANPPCKAPPMSQEVEAARKAATTKRLTRYGDQTLPVSPAKMGYSTLNRPPSHTGVKDMSVDEITYWMRRMNMAQYTDIFMINGIDGTLLKSLDEDILTREFGLTRFNAIKLLKFANEGYRPT